MAATLTCLWTSTTIKPYFGIWFVLFCLTSVCLCEDYCIGSFDNCVCTEEKVECHNEAKLIDNLYNLYPKIKDHVKNITITGSSFHEMPMNFLGSCHNSPDLVLRDLKYLDLSSNQIRLVHSKTFHCIPYLETLILRDNQWQIDKKDDQLGYFTSMPLLKTLDLTNTFEDVYDGIIHFTKLAKIFNNTDMTALEELHLSHNEFIVLTKMAANTFCELKNLKFLNLSNNYFTEPSMPDKPDCLKNLEVLDFSSNKIERLNDEFISMIDSVLWIYGKLKSVQLQGNPFNCDCSLIKTWKWLRDIKAPVDKESLTCGSGYHSSYIGRRLVDLTLDELLCRPSTTTVVMANRVETPQSSSTLIIVVVVTTVIAVTVVIAVIAFCVKKYRVKNVKQNMLM